MKRQIITDIPIERLPSVVKTMGMKPYAANQIISWLYKRRVTSFDEMTNLSKGARDCLKENYSIGRLKLERELKASDGTKKFLFSASDGVKIESVLIYAPDGRVTLCISTQAGCAMGCSFCRTGRMGFRRDLTQGEILGQLIEVQRLTSHVPRPTSLVPHITNIVLMGMGEPFANYMEVANAIRIILDARALNFSKRRVTVSTSGLLPQMIKFSQDFDVKLAISLNATNDGVRDRLMPVNRRYPLGEIMKFCRDYSKKSRYRITFEYVMIKGVNDKQEHMKELVKLLYGVRAKINLIPFNPFPGCEFKAPLDSDLQSWFEYLIKHGIQTNIRVSRGQDILAACGQLAA